MVQAWHKTVSSVLGAGALEQLTLTYPEMGGPVFARHPEGFVEDDGSFHQVDIEDF